MKSLGSYRNLYKLESKVAVVAGGAGGIGRAVCEGLAAFGANVAVAGVHLDRVSAVADEINAAGGCAWAIKLDARD
ncbi:MAG: SDR family NAD(P)-dependent oxidoreductase, partial [Chloroflexi bacterium]